MRSPGSQSPCGSAGWAAAASRAGCGAPTARRLVGVRKDAAAGTHGWLVGRVESRSAVPPRVEPVPAVGLCPVGGRGCTREPRGHHHPWGRGVVPWDPAHGEGEQVPRGAAGGDLCRLRGQRSQTPACTPQYRALQQTRGLEGGRASLGRGAGVRGGRRGWASGVCGVCGHPRPPGSGSGSPPETAWAPQSVAQSRHRAVGSLVGLRSRTWGPCLHPFLKRPRSSLLEITIRGRRADPAGSTREGARALGQKAVPSPQHVWPRPAGPVCTALGPWESDVVARRISPRA